MGTGRAGATIRERSSPLRSIEAARDRLERMQNEVGRTKQAAQELDDLVREIARAYTGKTFILDDPRFRRFQKALAASLKALEEFTPQELEEHRGFEPVPAREFGVPLGKLKHALVEVPMSLAVARARLVALEKFFVRRTPSNGPQNSWSTAYFYWEYPDTRRLLRKHGPRAVVSELAVELRRYLNRLKAAKERFGAPVRPTELMLLAAIHGLPDEPFDGSREHYDLALDAWTKALRRAGRQRKPHRTGELSAS